jgi:hypothetical protein
MYSLSVSKIDKNKLPYIGDDVIFKKFLKKNYIDDDEVEYLYNLLNGRNHYRSELISSCMNLSRFDILIKLCSDYNNVPCVKKVLVEMVKLSDDKLMHFLTNGYSICMTDICLLSDKTHLLTGLKIDRWSNLFTTTKYGNIRLTGPHKLSLDAFTFLSKYFVYSKTFLENILQYCYAYDDFNDDYFNVIKSNITGFKLKLDFKVSDHCINELITKCQLKININYPLCTNYSPETVETILKNNCYVPIKFKLLNDLKYLKFIKTNTKFFELCEKYLQNNSINKTLAFYNDDYFNKITLEESDLINIVKETKNRQNCHIDIQKVFNKYPNFINIDVVLHIINNYNVVQFYSCLCQIMNNFNDTEKQIILFNIQDKAMSVFIWLTQIESEKPNTLFSLTESLIIRYCISLSRPIKMISKFIDDSQIKSIDEFFIIMAHRCSRNTNEHIMGKYGDRLSINKYSLRDYTVSVKYNHLQINQIVL